MAAKRNAGDGGTVRSLESRRVGTLLCLLLSAFLHFLGHARRTAMRTEDTQRSGLGELTRSDRRLKVRLDPMTDEGSFPLGPHVYRVVRASTQKRRNSA